MSPQGSANLRTAEEDVEYILVKGKNALIFDFFLSNIKYLLCKTIPSVFTEEEINPNCY